MANFAARDLALENLPEIDPLPEGIVLPAVVASKDPTDPLAGIRAVRALYCRTLATDDTDCDERIDRVRRTTDPLALLSIVAPHALRLVRTVEVVPVPAMKRAEIDALDEAMAIVEANIHAAKHATGASFTDHGTATETVDKFARSQKEAEEIARETGGVVKGFD